MGAGVRGPRPHAADRLVRIAVAHSSPSVTATADGVPCRSPGTVRCPGTSARVASRIPKALRGRWHSPRCKMRGEKTGQVIKGTRPRPRVLADGQKQSSDPSLGPRRLGSLPRTHRAVFFTSARRRQCKLHV